MTTSFTNYQESVSSPFSNDVSDCFTMSPQTPAASYWLHMTRNNGQETNSQLLSADLINIFGGIHFHWSYLKLSYPWCWVPWAFFFMLTIFSKGLLWAYSIVWISGEHTDLQTKVAGIVLTLELVDWGLTRKRGPTCYLTSSMVQKYYFSLQRDTQVKVRITFSCPCWECINPGSLFENRCSPVLLTHRPQTVVVASLFYSNFSV